MVRKVGQTCLSGENAKSGIQLTKTKFLQIGIQGLPGTEFSINNSGEKITIGHTGIYEINFENFGVKITTLTIESNDIYGNNDYLIIDYIFEEEEGVQ